MGWASNLLIILSLWFLGKKKPIGWVFSILGNFGWCIYAAQLELWSALAMDGITMCLGLYNFWLWRIHEKDKIDPR